MLLLTNILPYTSPLDFSFCHLITTSSSKHEQELQKKYNSVENSFVVDRKNKNIRKKKDIAEPFAKKKKKKTDWKWGHFRLLTSYNINEMTKPLHLFNTQVLLFFSSFFFQPLSHIIHRLKLFSVIFPQGYDFYTSDYWEDNRLIFPTDRNLSKFYCYL